MPLSLCDGSLVRAQRRELASCLRAALEANEALALGVPFVSGAPVDEVVRRVFDAAIARIRAAAGGPSSSGPIVP